MHFIRETQVRNTFIYREQMRSNAQRLQFYLRVNIRDLNAFDEQLHNAFATNPTEYIKVFESAIQTIYRVDYYDENNLEMEPCPKFQLQIHSDENPVMIRDLQSNLVGKLICVPGIITSTSKSNIRARKCVYTCTNCGHEKVVELNFGLARAIAPAICEQQRMPGIGNEKANCPMNSY